MVLSLMRRHAKSWLIKFLIGMIAVVFIFYFGYSFRAKEGLKIAYVNGELITGAAYQKAFRDMVEVFRRQYRQFWSEDLIETLNVKEQALQNLINQKLVSQEARDLGLSVTEEEIKRAIMEYPAFQSEGRFDLRQYQFVLSQNRMEPEDFEAAMAQDLLEKKLSQFMFAFMEVTKEELRRHYAYENEAVKVSFVNFQPEAFKASVDPEPEAISTYFEEHKESYRIPEKIKVTYLEIDPADFSDRVTVGEAEINNYYDYNLDLYTEPKKVKARHILFKIPQDAGEEQEQQVEKKAGAVLEKARSGEDFAELARTHSEGPTKEKGGDLGYFSEGQMVKPFEEAAFNMAPGEVSDLVRTRFGYHIIRVEDVKEARTKPLEEVRDEIVDTIIDTVSKELAHEKALSLMDQMPYEVDLSRYAEEQERETKTTEFFSESEPIPGLGGGQPLRSTLFGLGDMETSDLVEIDEKYYVFQVAARAPDYLPELEEVEKQVRQDFISQRSRELARKAAEQHLSKLKAGAAWDQLAKERGMTPQQSEFVNRQQPIPQMGSGPELKEVIFALSQEKPYPEKIITTPKGIFVVRWEGYRGMDPAKFAEEREEYRSKVLQTKHRRAFVKWLENLRKKADIEIVTPVT